MNGDPPGGLTPAGEAWHLVGLLTVLLLSFILFIYSRVCWFVCLFVCLFVFFFFFFFFLSPRRPTGCPGQVRMMEIHQGGRPQRGGRAPGAWQRRARLTFSTWPSRRKSAGAPRRSPTPGGCRRWHRQGCQGCGDVRPPPHYQGTVLYCTDLTVAFLYRQRATAHVTGHHFPL